MVRISNLKSNARVALRKALSELQLWETVPGPKPGGADYDARLLSVAALLGPPARGGASAAAAAATAAELHAMPPALPWRREADWLHVPEVEQLQQRYLRGREEQQLVLGEVGEAVVFYEHYRAQLHAVAEGLRQQVEQLRQQQEDAGPSSSTAGVGLPNSLLVYGCSHSLASLPARCALAARFLRGRLVVVMRRAFWMEARLAEMQALQAELCGGVEGAGGGGEAGEVEGGSGEEEEEEEGRLFELGALAEALADIPEEED